MDPVTMGILLTLAVGSKLYGTKKQQDKYADIRRSRNRYYEEAQRKKEKKTQEALAKAKETRDKFRKKEVDKETAELATSLTSDFSALPRREYSAPAPVRPGEPTIITNARTAADAKALKDINRYAQDTAGLQALTSAFTSPGQRDTALMNRAAILEKARQQRKIAEILGLQVGQLDPYSQEAEMANSFGDILMTAALV